MSDQTLANVLHEVADERYRQDRRWGEQNHSPAYFFAILAEEHGEVAKEVVEYTFDEADGIIDGAPEVLARLRSELVQEAAVAVAFIEAIDRRPESPKVSREEGVSNG